MGKKKTQQYKKPKRKNNKQKVVYSWQLLEKVDKVKDEEPEQKPRVYRNVMMLRHGKVISLIINKSPIEILTACMFKNVEKVRYKGYNCIDVSKTNFKCWDCLVGIDHNHEISTLDDLKVDVELIKQVIDLPVMIIRTCLVKNKGDLVETVLQLQNRNYKDHKRSGDNVISEANYKTLRSGKMIL
jgi:hypothetical protein